MAKTNFTKVEEILAEGLRKITVHHLYDLAEQASKRNEDTVNEAETRAIQRLHTLAILLKDINYLKKRGFDPKEKFGIKSKELKNYIENPDTITNDVWNKITDILAKVEVCKKSLSENEKKDEDLIDEQRRRHITKRFNINEKWLPLQ